ncbi:MAG: hypothetical protein ACXVQU_12820 [Actinomycetota bacterium]
MKRCPGCGSLRLLWALDGTRAFCARCHRRLSGDYARPLFGAAADVTQILRTSRTSEPDPAA